MREDVIETSKSPNKWEYTPDERGEAASFEETKEDSSLKERIRVLKLQLVETMHDIGIMIDQN